MRRLSRVIAFVLPGAILAGLSIPAIAAEAPSPFDKPLNVVHVPLPLDKDNPQAKPEITCAYYPHFAVKQVDLGEIGAFQLSIIPVSAGGQQPACRKDNAVNEKVVPPDDWTGYFDGVKASYVFFVAEDGWNDGMGFAVFTPDAKKLFDDVAKDRPSVETTPKGIALRYLRVFGARCSLRIDQAACWAKIKHDTGLTQAIPPDCTALYVKEQQRTPKFAKQILSDPTIIDYEVSVAIEGAAPKTTPATGNALGCRPAE